MTIKESMRASLDIYQRRMKGETGIWSATTRCIKCGATWLWGVEENLYFICPSCPRKLEVKDLDVPEDHPARMGWSGGNVDGEDVLDALNENVISER